MLPNVSVTPPAEIRIVKQVLVGHLGLDRDDMVFAVVIGPDGRHRVGVKPTRSHCSCGVAWCQHAALAAEGWFPRPAAD